MQNAIILGHEIFNSERIFKFFVTLFRTYGIQKDFSQDVSENGNF